MYNRTTTKEKTLLWHTVDIFRFKDGHQYTFTLITLLWHRRLEMHVINCWEECQGCIKWNGVRGKSSDEMMSKAHQMKRWFSTSHWTGLKLMWYLQISLHNFNYSRLSSNLLHFFYLRTHFIRTFRLIFASI